MADQIQVVTGEEIVNPRTGQKMAFRRTGADTGGRELIIECWSPADTPDAPREPVHIHPKQEKVFRIIDGELTVMMDGQTRTLRAGDECVVPAGAAHAFWNDSSQQVHYWQEFRPALRSAEFFVTLFALARDGELDAQGKPGMLQAAASMPRFRDEIFVTSPPPWLQQIAFAVLAPVARLAGRKPERR